jgi:hypothetical protein
MGAGKSEIKVLASGSVVFVSLFPMAESRRASQQATSSGIHESLKVDLLILSQWHQLDFGED